MPDLGDDLTTAVVIPTYNEAENLPQLVSVLFSLPIDARLIIIDDHSPDGTGSIADGLAAADPMRIQVIHRAGKLGLRSAYLTGFRVALDGGAGTIAQMDADLSHDPSELVNMVPLTGEFDLVLGSRYVKGGRVDSDWPLWRKALSAFGNLYARSILGVPLHDLTTGFRVWRKEALAGMPLERLRANGYVFLVEMAYLACCLNYRCCEHPIYFCERQHGRSKMSLGIQVEAALRVWQVLWTYRDLRKTHSGVC